eukprot:SAG31_NODE_159_length_21911_cov_12.220750_21_plen_52_part_00
MGAMHEIVSENSGIALLARRPNNTKIWWIVGAQLVSEVFNPVFCYQLRVVC